MTTIVQDAFTDTNGTALTAHTPDTAPGGSSWANPAGGNAIQSNKAQANGTVRGHSVIESGEADCIITVKARSDSTNAAVARDAGIIFRWTDTDHYWWCGINAAADAFRIIERNGGNGAETTRATTAVTIDTATEYTIVITLSGQSLVATLDGGNEISYGSASVNETATIHGIKLTTATDTADDFLVETAGGGTQYQQAVTGAMTPAGAVVERTNKAAAGSVTPAGVVAKSTSTSLAGSVTPSGIVARLTAIIAGGSITPVGVLTSTKTALVSLAGAITPAGALALRTVKNLIGAITPDGSLVKRSSKALSGEFTPSGIVTTVKAALISLAGSLAPSGALVKRAGKGLAGSITPAGGLIKWVGKAASGALAAAGELATQFISGGGNQYFQEVAGTLAPAGALVKQTGKTLIGVLISTGSVVKRIAANTTGTINPSGILSKSINTSLAGGITPIGILSTSRLFFLNISGSISPSGMLDTLLVEVVIVGLISFSYSSNKPGISINVTQPGASFTSGHPQAE